MVRVTDRKCSHTDMQREPIKFDGFLHAVNPTRENFVTLEPNGLLKPPWRIIVIHILLRELFYVVHHFRLSLLNNYLYDIVISFINSVVYVSWEVGVVSVSRLSFLVSGSPRLKIVGTLAFMIGFISLLVKWALQGLVEFVNPVSVFHGVRPKPGLSGIIVPVIDYLRL